jgi:hypothetical protein
MIAIPLGLVTVAAAGTPQALCPLTAAQLLQLQAGTLCFKVEVWPNPAATGKVYIKQGGVILAALPVVSGGYPIPWEAGCAEGCNCINPLPFQIDAATTGDGAYVTVWVR